MVASLKGLMMLLVSEDMPGEKKPVGESKPPSPDKNRGKIQPNPYADELGMELVTARAPTTAGSARGLGGGSCQNHSAVC